MSTYLKTRKHTVYCLHVKIFFTREWKQFRNQNELDSWNPILQEYYLDPIFESGLKSPEPSCFLPILGMGVLNHLVSLADKHTENRFLILFNS